jgi:spermidine/putrescine transport system permease protein
MRPPPLPPSFWDRWSGLRLLDAGLGIWTGLVFLFLYLPILVLVVYSFNESRLNVVWEGFTMEWYGRLWDDTRIARALKNSLVVAGFTTVLSVVLGTVGAWLLHRYRYRFGSTLQTLIAVPMINV